MMKTHLLETLLIIVTVGGLIGWRLVRVMHKTQDLATAQVYLRWFVFTIATAAVAIAWAVAGRFM